jgi:hypothetical protein
MNQILKWIKILSQWKYKLHLHAFEPEGMQFGHLAKNLFVNLLPVLVLAKYIDLSDHYHSPALGHVCF